MVLMNQFQGQEYNLKHGQQNYGLSRGGEGRMN